MKIVKTQRSVVQSQGMGSATRFSIEASAHAFNMLSSGLYSDKKAAVLREIGCNAADAHAVAGMRHVPFEVKLPTEFDSEFWIKDWGPGLDEAGVRHLYTTYFSSTKQDSNEVTGAFGLGSKSPFSYTDSFTVIACHGGVQRVFMAYRDEEGNPLIKSVGKPQPVDKSWQTGIRVGFAVNRADFDEFRTKAIQVFQWFDPLPVVKGLPKDWKPQFSRWLDNELIAISSGRPDSAAKSLVLMGNVAYPLEISEVFQGGVVVNNGRFIATPASVEQSLAANAIVLKLPIGTVQVAASREVLQYNDGTRKALRDALVTALQSVYDHAVNRVFRAWKENTGWSRRVAIAEEVEALPYVFHASGTRFLTERLMKLGIPADEVYVSHTHKTAQAIPEWVTTDKESGLTVKYLEAVGKSRAKTTLVHEGMYQKGKKQVEVELDYKPSTRIYIADVDQAEARTVVAHLSGDALLVIQRGRDKAEAERVAQQISDEMGGVPLIKVSTLPALKPKSPKGRTKVDLLEFGNYSSMRDRWLLSPNSVELDDVPDDCRFFLVRDGAPAAQKTVHHVDYLDGEGVLCQHSQASWEQVGPLLTDGMSILRKWQVASGTVPKGFILVPPTAVARLELLEQGFRPILGEIRSVLRSAEFGRILARRGVAGMPFRQHHFAGPTGGFAHRYLQDEGFRNMAGELLDEDIGKLLAQTQPCADAALSHDRWKLEQSIGPLWRFLDLESRVFVSWEQVVATLDERYPALHILDSRKVQTWPVTDLQNAMRCIVAPVSAAHVKLAA